MKQQTINLKYSLARSKALSHYLEKQGKTIESALSSHIDDLYDALVPDEVREFVASQNPEDVQEKAPDNNQRPEKSARQSSRKKHVQTKDDEITQADAGPVLTM